MRTSDLIKRIEAHCRQTNISESTFGRKAVNDGKLVKRLRQGKTITVSTWHLIEAELASSQADNAA